MARLLETSIADTQTQSSQNQIREAAVRHFALSAEYGVFAEEKDRQSLVLQAAEGFWNTSIPFQKSKTTRQLVMWSLQDILQHLHEVQDKHYEFQVQLYSLLFTCMKDQRLWENGYETAQEALQTIPKEFSRQLWRQTILFVRKMNRTISLGMFNTKEKDDLLQAEVYRRSSI